jgi:hypothetical protein
MTDDDLDLTEQAKDVISEFLRRLANVQLPLALQIAKYLLLRRGEEMDAETKQYIRDIRDFIASIRETLRVLGLLEDIDEYVTIKEYLRRISEASTNTYLFNRVSYQRTYFGFNSNRSNPEFEGYSVLLALVVEFEEFNDPATGATLWWQPRRMYDPITLVGSTEASRQLLTEYNFPAYGDFYLGLLRLRRNVPQRITFSPSVFIQSRPYTSTTGFVYEVGLSLSDFVVLHGSYIPISLQQIGDTFEAFFPSDENYQNYEGVYVQPRLYPMPSGLAIIEDDDEFIFYVLNRTRR